MHDSSTKRVTGVGRRLLAAILGLVLGLLGGLLVALFTVGPGELFFPVLGAVAVGSAVLGGSLPGPFLAVSELVLSIFADAS
jgi:hypothetical protein